jgi:hypothetical protein
MMEWRLHVASIRMLGAIERVQRITISVVSVDYDSSSVLAFIGGFTTSRIWLLSV